VSITDQRKLIILQHDWLDLAHVGLGGTMLGYGLVGTIVVVLLIVLCAVYEAETVDAAKA
jgi:hypothetical protein